MGHSTSDAESCDQFKLSFSSEKGFSLLQGLDLKELLRSRVALISVDVLIFCNRKTVASSLQRFSTQCCIMFLSLRRAYEQTLMYMNCVLGYKTN